VHLAALRCTLRGTGNMGDAVRAGAQRAGVAPRNVIATEMRPERAAEMASAYSITTTADNTAAVKDADIVILAVKPHIVAGVLAEIGPALQPRTLVVSIAAGLPIALYEERLPAHQPVIRVMPNTPAMVGAGIAAVSPGSYASAADVALAMAILAGTGEVVEVPESQQDAVCAISGSGPAYMFYIVDALAEAGVFAGLARDLATQLAVQTMLGSARLLAETGDHPAIAREKVTSPGGTTARALQVLDTHAVRAAFMAAVMAAVDRAAQIAAKG
jgi:pyrroline-5-carboxylate reductase